MPNPLERYEPQDDGTGDVAKAALFYAIVIILLLFALWFLRSHRGPRAPRPPSFGGVAAINEEGADIMVELKVQAMRFGGPADAQGKILAEGSMKASATVPVLRDFDTSHHLGVAVIGTDGSAEIKLADGERIRQDEDFTIGYRVLKSHREGDVNVIDEVDAVCVSLVDRSRKA